MQHRSRARGQGCRVSSPPHRTGNDGCPSLCPEVSCPAVPAIGLALDASEPAGSKHTEQGFCPAASCQQLSDTWAQLRHSPGTAQTHTHSSDTPRTQLGTAHPALSRAQATAWARRCVRCPPQPWSEGLGCRAVGRLGQATHRAASGVSVERHHSSIRVAPCTLIHTPGQTRGQRTWPKHHHLAWCPRQAGFCTLTEKLPRNEKSPWFCPTLKPSAGVLGAGQGSCCRQGVPGCSQGGSLGSGALAPPITTQQPKVYLTFIYIIAQPVSPERIGMWWVRHQLPTSTS